ncbi:hypothetical protein CHELA20_50175 [Hyphomicrobiales bacterium]|nr:hypothetical protein CHELA41_20196 [Hyphomicrobiales bacterium]CAH1667211.1 hypothetical protein CHELA20_50175 [Hyphomicrobiales bacterium]
MRRATARMSISERETMRNHARMQDPRYIEFDDRVSILSIPLAGGNNVIFFRVLYGLIVRTERGAADDGRTAPPLLPP